MAARAAGRRLSGRSWYCCATVHHDLIFDSRGDRAGWPVEVWNDLVLLQEIHEQVYGKLQAGADPWKSFFLNT